MPLVAVSGGERLPDYPSLCQGRPGRSPPVRHPPADVLALRVERAEEAPHARAPVPEPAPPSAPSAPRVQTPAHELTAPLVDLRRDRAPHRAPPEIRPGAIRQPSPMMSRRRVLASEGTGSSPAAACASTARSRSVSAFATAEHSSCRTRGRPPLRLAIQPRGRPHQAQGELSTVLPSCDASRLNGRPVARRRFRTACRAPRATPLAPRRPGTLAGCPGAP